MWPEVKDDLVKCLNLNFEVGALTNSQRQIVITLLQKPNKDNRRIDSWRPISLINVDIKICSKVLSNRITTVLPYLIHTDQSAFIKGRNIDEPLRLIQDIMDYIKLKSKSLLLFAADFEKAFDSLEHNFIVTTLKHFGFGNNYIKWIQIMIGDNHSSIANNGWVTNSFQVKRGTKQGDSISPYIFILILEILATMIRTCEDITGFKIKEKEIKLALFADDTTFFLNDSDSFQNVLSQLKLFQSFTSLKINVKKSEAGWLGKNQDATLGHTEMQRIDFLYNNNLKRVLTNFTTTLSLWKMRNLTSYGKIQVLKSLALPKLYYICSKTHVSKDFIKIVENNMKDFIWNGKKPKIKYKTLIGDYSSGGLKLPDFESQLSAIKIQQIIKLISIKNEQKTASIIPSHYLESIGGIEQIHVNFDPDRIPENIPLFYKEILLSWANFTRTDPSNELSIIQDQYIWNNRHIYIDNKSIFYKDFSSLKINKIIDLCDYGGEFKWSHAKNMGLNDKDYLRWAGIIRSIPKEWKSYLKTLADLGKYKNQCEQFISLNDKKVEIGKLKTNHCYREIVRMKFEAPTSQLNLSNRIRPNLYEEMFFDWKQIYGRIYKTTIDTYLRMFQYKILNNILYLNRDLYRFKLIDCPSCSFCLFKPETIDHLFVECIESKNYYFEIRNWLERFNVKLPELIKSKMILGVEDNTINFIMLIYKLSLYKAREKGKIPTLSLFKNLLKFYEYLERKVAKSKNKILQHVKKWEKILNALNPN